MTLQIKRPRPRFSRNGFHHTFSSVLTLVVAMLCGIIFTAVACNSGENRPLVFISDRDGNLDIYAVNVASGDEKNLTESLQDEFNPIVSPDGKVIAFQSGTEANSILETMHVVDRDHTSRQALTNSMGKDRDQKWSPNEKRLAFIRETADRTNLYVINSDGSDAMSLTSIPADEIGGWSPDGKSILFAVRDGKYQGIYQRNPDGVNEYQLTDIPGYSPRWSPDNKFIAFISSFQDDNPDIYIMSVDRINLNKNFDRANLKRITTPETEHSLSWSPDSTLLLFVSGKGDNAEIYTFDVESYVRNRLTHNDVRDDEPVWESNSERIAFVSMLDGDSEIFVMNSDGSNQIRLTNDTFNNTSPSW